MKFSCPSCSASFNINPDIIPDGGQKARCPKCRVKFIIRKTVRSTPAFPRDNEVPVIRTDENVEEAKEPLADTLTMTLTGLNVLRKSEPSIRRAFGERFVAPAGDWIENDQVIADTALEIYQTMPLPLRIMVADIVFVEYCLENRHRLIVRDEPAAAEPEDVGPSTEDRSKCPKCGAEQLDREECHVCGIVFCKYMAQEKQEEKIEPIQDRGVAAGLTPHLHPGEKILAVINDVYGQPLVMTNTSLIADKTKGGRKIENSDFGRFYLFDIVNADANPHLLGLVFEVESQREQIAKFIIAEEKALRLFYDVFYPRLQRFLTRKHTMEDDRDYRLLAEIQKMTDINPKNSKAAGENHP